MRAQRRRNGQAMVEFAMVFPIFSMLCFGIISSSYLFFQASALTNGARNGARLAAVEFEGFNASATTYTTCSGKLGESSDPTTVAAAAIAAMPGVAVDPSILCETGVGTATCPTGAGGTLNFAQQTGPTGSQASITMVLTCGNTTATYGEVTSVTVVVSRTIKGLAPPTSGSYTYTAQSQTPTLIGF